MEARSGVGNLEYSTDREESKNFKLSRTYCSKKKINNLNSSPPTIEFITLYNEID